MSRWNPWADAAQLRSENWSLKRRLKEGEQLYERERAKTRVFHTANQNLVEEVYRLQCEVNTLKGLMAQMHRRDPATGRLLPRGK